MMSRKHTGVARRLKHWEKLKLRKELIATNVNYFGYQKQNRTIQEIANNENYLGLAEI